MIQQDDEKALAAEFDAMAQQFAVSPAQQPKAFDAGFASDEDAARWLDAFASKSSGRYADAMPEQTFATGAASGFVGAAGTAFRAARLPEEVTVNVLAAFGLDDEDQKVVRHVIGLLPGAKLLRALSNRGEVAQGVAQDLAQGRPTFAGSVGQVAGMAVAMAPASIVGGYIGAASAAGRVGATAATVARGARIGGSVASGLQGAAIESESMLEQGEALGASPKQKLAAMAAGAVVGSTEAFGAEQALARLGKAFASGSREVRKRVAVEVLHEALKSGVQEGVEEIGQGLGEEAITQWILEDPDKHGRSIMDWLKTTASVAMDQGLPAAIVGMVMGGAARAAELSRGADQGPLTGGQVDPNAPLNDFGALNREQQARERAGPNAPADVPAEFEPLRQAVEKQNQTPVRFVQPQDSEKAGRVQALAEKLGLDVAFIEGAPQTVKPAAPPTQPPVTGTVGFEQDVTQGAIAEPALPRPSDATSTPPATVKSGPRERLPKRHGWEDVAVNPAPTQAELDQEWTQWVEQSQMTLEDEAQTEADRVQFEMDRDEFGARFAAKPGGGLRYPAAYAGGRVVLDVNSANPVRLLFHEGLHHLARLNPEGFRRLLRAMTNLKPQQIEAARRAYATAFGKDAPTGVALDEEAAAVFSEDLADLLEQAFNDPAKLARVFADRSVFEVVRDMIARIAKRFGGQMQTSIEKRLAALNADGDEVKLALLWKETADAVSLWSELPDDEKAKFAVGWHGSPHDFDRFDSSKIGTGEGAQAYGHGLYIGGRRAVGEHYRKKLSAPKRTLQQRAGEVYGEFDSPSDATEAFTTAPGFTDSERMLLKTLAADGWLGFDYPHQAINAALGKDIDNFDPSPELKAAVEALNAERRGKLYEVELAPAEDEYLLWDRPLSEQPQAVRDALAGLGYVVDKKKLAEFDDALFEALSVDGPTELPTQPVNLSGEDVYKRIAKGDQTRASAALHAAGIRGIKYLDGSSRSKGEGDYNYVLFDDKDITIKAKFAVAPPTDSAEFKRWFGDSKVVDEQGRPLVVYHGTAGISAASVARGLKRTLFLSPDAAIAAHYSGFNDQTVMPLYVAADKVLSVDGVAGVLAAARRGGMSEERVVELRDEHAYAWQALEDREVTDALSRAGWDAAWNSEDFMGDGSRPEDQHTSLAVWPGRASIKSATGNRGTFDPANPDIRFAVDRGPVDVRALATRIEGQFPGVVMELSEARNNPYHSRLWSLDSIVVPSGERGHGTGSKAMAALVQAADAAGATIGLNPSTDFGATSVDRLRKFYSRFGFKRNTGRSADLSVSAAMLRLPQGSRFAAAPQTDSAEFKRWFGDSKVVDENGEPLVVMHASTYGDITEFYKKEQRFGKAGYGFYFSDAYGSNLFAEYGQRFQMDLSSDGKKKAVKTYPVYLRLNNPLVVDHVDDLKRYVDVGQKFGVARGFLGNLAPDALLKLQRMGYDGIITRETTAPKVHKSQGLKILGRNDPKAVSFPVYVAFEPEQIKSATGNRGTFDPANPDIRFAVALPDWADEFEAAGHKIDSDGTVLLYHGTTAAKAERMISEGALRSADGANDDYGVHASTSPEIGQHYGDGTTVPIRFRAKDLRLEDQFPDGRMDFAARTRNLVYRPVAIGPKAVRAKFAVDPERVSAAAERAAAEGEDTESPVGDEMPMRLERPAENIDPTSAPDVIDALAKVIEAADGGTPIRTGRMGRKSRTAAGFFKVRPEVIRLKTANDIPTAAHETAHALEKHVYGWPKGGPWKNPLVNLETQRELVALGRALYGDRKPAGGYKREGFAEYVRLYVSNPDALPEAAPKFHEWFTQAFLPSLPKVAKQIDRARELATRWRQQGAVARAKASVIDPASASEKWKKLREKLRYTRILTEVLESGQALKEAQAAAESRADLKPENAPFTTFDELRLTHDAKVAYMAEKGMIDFNGNVVGGPLSDITPLIKGRYHDFVAFLWAQRALALRASGRNAGISIADAQQIVKELGDEKMQLAASKLYEWNDGVLNYAAEASPHFGRVVARIRAVDPGFYIPLQREMDQLDRSWAGGMADGGNPLKKLRGSGRRIKDPIQTVLSRARKLVLAAHQRKVMDQVIALSRVEGMGQWIEEVPPTQVPLVQQSLGDVLKKIEEKVDPLGEGVEGIDQIREQFQDLLDLSMTEFGDASRPDTKDPIIPYWEDGEVRWYQVNPDLYRALSTMEVYRLPGMVGAVAGGATRAFRAGTTGLRATFGMIRNPARDVQALLLQSRATTSTPVMVGLWMQQMGRSFISSVTAGKVTDEWADLAQRLGVTMAQPLGQDISHTKRAARRLSQGTMVRTMDPRNWFDWFREFIQFPEGATRTAEIRAIARDIGWKPGELMTREQAQRLTLAGKKVTTDFTASGNFSRVMNQIVPFFNSAIQGPRAAAQAIKHHPVKFMLRGMAITAATVALWLQNRDEEWWKEIPDEEKYGYWHFKIEVDGKTEIVRLPRAYEIGGVFAALPEAMLEAWYADDPEAASEWARQFVATTTPDITPAVAKPFIEWMANYDFFRERPIVPRGEQDKPAEEQVGPYTSRLAKVFGERIGASPRKIDHAINSIFGPVAGDVITGLGLGAQARAARGEAAELPVVGTLFRRGGELISRPKSVEKLYDAYGAALKLQASDKIEETREQRNSRLALQDAVQAVGALSFIRWEAPDEGVRKIAYLEMLAIARDARAAAQAGTSHPKQYDRAAKMAKRQREQLESAQPGNLKP